MSFVVDVTVGVMVAVVVISGDGGDGVCCSLEEELIDDIHNDDDDDDDARWERLLTIVNASTVLGTSSSSCKMQMTNSNTFVVVTGRVR